jgi:uncharacterized protein
LVALSGGVDSAVVALGAKHVLGDKAFAITADYKTLAESEMSTAKKVAMEIGIRHKIICYSELEDPDFIKNDHLRCYYCRRTLSRQLLSFAKKVDISCIVDGTNADDLSDYRPGIKALKEFGIRSPLLEKKIGKVVVREIAKHYNLSVYNKPANSCLASRIPHGIKITEQKLRKIEEAENIIKDLFKVEQVRVRDHTDIARIEIDINELVKMFDLTKLMKLDYILKNIGFRYVSLDLGGYKKGKLVVLK